MDHTTSDRAAQRRRSASVTHQGRHNAVATTLLLVLGLSACSSSESPAETEHRAGTEAATPSEGGPAEQGERERDAADAARGGAAGDEGDGGAGEDGGAAGRVELSEAGFATARIAVERPSPEAAVAVAGGIEAPGQVDFIPSRVALISPRAEGRLERVMAEPGDQLRAGQTVALVSSSEFVTAQSDYLQARRRREVLAETPDAEGARALEAGARRRLELLGAGPALIREIDASGSPLTLLPITAPFAGTILEAMTLAGAAVEAGTALFRIGDLSTLYVTAAVPERALPLVRPGAPAVVRISAVPGRTLSGRVSRVGGELDKTNRTVAAMITVQNPDRELRPGMFATVTITPVAGSGTATADGDQARKHAPAVSVPSAAVVTDGEARYVFVQVAPLTYERRAVEIRGGRAAGEGRVLVLSGIGPEDLVVTRGAFTLKSELAKASFAEEE